MVLDQSVRGLGGPPVSLPYPPAAVTAILRGVLRYTSPVDSGYLF